MICIVNDAYAIGTVVREKVGRLRSMLSCWVCWLHHQKLGMRFVEARTCAGPSTATGNFKFQFNANARLSPRGGCKPPTVQPNLLYVKNQPHPLVKLKICWPRNRGKESSRAAFWKPIYENS